MNKKEIKNRKRELALQAFYLQVKQLIEELEKKLNPESKKETLGTGGTLPFKLNKELLI